VWASETKNPAKSDITFSTLGGLVTIGTTPCPEER
jgi:hypothetical protein